ncbi:hypothetical protein K502DRAFT_353355 [Neoconidiobolus thromboides FSU 785]|nr:hypothetical protein K502DRAFT_353355 [Neoconidiobolus thromboides FSU 785]
MSIDYEKQKKLAEEENAEKIRMKMQVGANGQLTEAVKFSSSFQRKNKQLDIYLLTVIRHMPLLYKKENKRNETGTQKRKKYSFLIIMEKETKYTRRLKKPDRATGKPFYVNCGSLQGINNHEKDRIRKELKARKLKTQTEDEINRQKEEVKLFNLQRVNKRDKEITKNSIKLVTEWKMNIRKAEKHLSISCSSVKNIVDNERYKLAKIINVKKQVLKMAMKYIKEVNELKKISKKNRTE